MNVEYSDSDSLCRLEEDLFPEEFSKLFAIPDIQISTGSLSVHKKFSDEKEGVCYLAFGDDYLEMALVSFASLREFEPSVPVIVLIDEETCVDNIPLDDNLGVLRLEVKREYNRVVKTSLPDYVPFDRCIFLDSDTVIQRPIRSLFSHLKAFDLCLALDYYPDLATTLQIRGEERRAILDVCPGDAPYYQSGVIAWRRSKKTQTFFRTWREEWQRFQRVDQGALVRAIWRSHVRLGILWSKEWNYPKRIPGLRIFHPWEVQQRSQRAFPAEKRIQPPKPSRQSGARPHPSLSETHAVSKGVCYVTYGQTHFDMACQSLSSLRKVERDIHCTILTEKARCLPKLIESDGIFVKEIPADDENSILTQVPLHVGYKQCLVLHSQSRILKPLLPIFRYLEAFDLCLAGDTRGTIREARYLSDEEKSLTTEVCPKSALFYNHNVMCWIRTPDVLEFYSIWNSEWNKHRQHLEGAFTRAIWNSRVRIGLLSSFWNSPKQSRLTRILCTEANAITGPV